MWCRRRRLFFFASPRLRKKRWEMPLARSQLTLPQPPTPEPRARGCTACPWAAAARARARPHPPPALLTQRPLLPLRPAHRRRPPRPSPAPARLRSLALSPPLSPARALQLERSGRPPSSRLALRALPRTALLALHALPRANPPPLAPHSARSREQPLPLRGLPGTSHASPPTARSRGPPLPLMHH